ncbi:hypothetical protein PVAG01_08427 [Phlyctema vagabunda]|uniref:SnoaL-like domain-containing protein n=1 Tax=Phlyctema vagabunda TaxID=108571 RepID=A0ABR4P9D8_9HELO
MATSDYDLIRNTIATYAISIDGKDYATLADLFTPDSYILIGGFDEMHGGQILADGVRHSLGHLTTHHSITT